MSRWCWTLSLKCFFLPPSHGSAETPSNVDGDARQFINRRSPFLKESKPIANRVLNSGKLDGFDVQPSDVAAK